MGTKKIKKKRTPSANKGNAQTEGKAVANIEDIRRTELIASVSELATGIQDGTIKGIISLAITDDSGESDRLRFAGARPPARVLYLLKLAERFVVDGAIQAINKGRGGNG